MNSIYNGFAFVKALSINDLKTINKDGFSDDKKDEQPFSHAVVEFRTVYKTYDGSFGFDWYRKKDNGLSYGGMYKSFIKSGYKDGITNLEADEAINRFLDMYEEYPINLPSRKNQKEREEKNYQVPYLSMFSKETVEKMKLPKDIVQPQFSIALCAIVEIARNSVLEFDYDTNLFEVTPKILADKSADRDIRQSKTSEITITCKKDLDANKEIKIYAYPQDKKYKRSLAGKIIVLQNDEKARKIVNFALVNVKTNVKNLPFPNANVGSIESVEIDTLRKAMYQCLIVPNIFKDTKSFDLTNDESFKIIQDSSGNNKYGKYIYHKTIPSVKWTDGGIFHSNDYTDCQDYVKKEYIAKNKNILSTFFKGNEYYLASKEDYIAENIFTVFAFAEDSFLNDRQALLPHAVEGEVKGIGENIAMLFNGLNGKRSDESVLAHETLHGLGLYHAHINEDPIKQPRILCTFAENETDNIMSYKDVTNEPHKKLNTLWRWQWKIVNSNIPSIQKDPK
ncbi:hypothetical protein [Chryseobacterium gambrini]|uniref:hypothetical protein n=1 Tax=Chryseobacterium gambrini TaxID=373672 RepID=UPI0022F3A7FF|nr:hypothetical protein [Chryseobacterium gambrini]WBX99337.1 hypothetical protein PE065_08820 [Chryseobacterium gambrini]